MHGRIKVRTSEEEKERKRKEQMLKMRAYKAAMAKIYAKRQDYELDDEMLQLTTQLLQRNPDIGTLWNIRRECLVVKSKTMQADAEELQKAYDTELNISERCLMVNPKSYYAWHHRCWSLWHSPKANWQRELQLCNQYLKLDERNFHTWDYRRHVVANAGVELQQELDYCTELIRRNFSNYSSWHHRSLMLPVLYPYDGDELPKRPMSEEKLKEELEMVITAAFTDPNDSSAWFYQRWLLGQSKAELAVCAFRCNSEKAVLAFTQPVLSKEGLTVSLRAEEAGDMALLKLEEWQPLSGEQGACHTWHCKLKGDLKLDSLESFVLQVNIPNQYSTSLKLQKLNDELLYFMPPNRAFHYSQGVLNELQSQLESCDSLLEYEPDSKWTLLTSALLMREVDPIKHHEKSMEHLKQLQTVDPMRLGYYKDMAAKWLLERVLSNWQQSAEFPKRLDLSEYEELASLQYAQYVCIVDELILPSQLAERYKESDGGLPTTFQSFSI